MVLQGVYSTIMFWIYNNLHVICIQPTTAILFLGFENKKLELVGGEPL